MKLREADSNEQAELIYSTPFEYLVAAILLTQSSIEAVNAVTPILFDKFPTMRAMANADRRDLERLIRNIGFYRQKAKQLPMTSRILVLNYESKVPKDLMSLTRLPGVARKTANLIMAELYGKTEGVLVDMRIRRVVARLDLANGKSAESVEKRLMEIVPKSDWIEFPRLLMQLGDKTCTVQKPICMRCPLKNLCPTSKSTGREPLH
ncbi:MAG: endonuclease III domain-containing protein [Candidatus Promineifilaceae bacterium]